MQKQHRSSDHDTTQIMIGKQFHFLIHVFPHCHTVITSEAVRVTDHAEHPSIATNYM